MKLRCQSCNKIFNCRKDFGQKIHCPFCRTLFEWQKEEKGDYKSYLDLAKAVVKQTVIDAKEKPEEALWFIEDDFYIPTFFRENKSYITENSQGELKEVLDDRRIRRKILWKLKQHWKKNNIPVEEKILDKINKYLNGEI